MTFTDDGSVYSIQDMFSERTLVFLAEGFTELMPLTLSSLYQPHCKWLRTASHTRVLSPHETQSASRLCLRRPPLADKLSTDSSSVWFCLVEKQCWNRGQVRMGVGYQAEVTDSRKGAGIDSFLVPGRGIKKGKKKEDHLFCRR